MMGDDDDRKLVPLAGGWRRHLQRGARSLEQGRFADAALEFERAVALAPAEPQALLALGRERLRQGRAREAETLLRAAHDRQPDSAATAAALARVLGLHLGRLEEAFALVHRALAAGGGGSLEERAPLQVIRGELLLEEGAFREARGAFAQALADPVSGEAARIGLARSFNLEGIALSEGGDDEQAIFAFKRAADLDPGWSGPCVNMGVAFGRLGRAAKAVEAYRGALERDAQNPVAHFNLGTALAELGQSAEAARTLEELLAVAPDYPRVRGALANVLGELGEFDRAVALLLEELDIDPANAGAWSSLGLAYACSGSVERGEECLLHALELDPGYFNAIQNLAKLYVAQHRYGEAEAVLARALDVDRVRARRLLEEDAQLAQLRPRSS
jgi:tetratricopeptide (TPR) repeat protein